jgi:hypothetical protein
MKYLMLRSLRQKGEKKYNETVIGMMAVLREGHPNSMYSAAARSSTLPPIFVLAVAASMCSKQYVESVRGPCRSVSWYLISARSRIPSTDLPSSGYHTFENCSKVRHEGQACVPLSPRTEVSRRCTWKPPARTSRPLPRPALFRCADSPRSLPSEGGDGERGQVKSPGRCWVTRNSNFPTCVISVRP